MGLTQRIRLKVKQIDGQQFVAVAINVDRDKDLVLVLFMHDREQARLAPLTVDQWNELPHHWFIDQGPAPKTETLYDPDQEPPP